MKTKLTELKTRLMEVDDLNMAAGVLYWDQATNMPPGGAAAREEPQCVTEKQLEQIIAADRQASENPRCAAMGCSLGTRYAVCE